MLSSIHTQSSQATKRSILCTIWSHISLQNLAHSHYRFLFIIEKGISWEMQDNSVEKSKTNWWDTIPNGLLYKSRPQTSANSISIRINWSSKCACDKYSNRSIERLCTCDPPFRLESFQRIRFTADRFLSMGLCPMWSYCSSHQRVCTVLSYLVLGGENVRSCRW